MHVFTVRADGSELRQMTHTPGEVNAFPRWSADGRFLYFFREKPTVSFLKVPVTGGTATEVGPWSLLSRARVDATDKKVVFERREGDETSATIVRELATGRETTLPHVVRYPHWTRSGQTIIGTEDATGADGQMRQRIVACRSMGPATRWPKERRACHRATIPGCSFCGRARVARPRANCGQSIATVAASAGMVNSGRSELAPSTMTSPCVTRLSGPWFTLAKIGSG